MARYLTNDKAIQAAKPGPADFKINDGGGLFLLVRSKTGAKLWRYRYKIAGRENLFALGEYPLMTLAEARAAREEAARLVKQGIHPAHQRQAERDANIEAAAAKTRKSENTFQRAALAWLEAGKAGKLYEQNGRPWAYGTERAKITRLERFALPKLGEMALEEITVNELRPLLLDLQTGGTWAAVHTKGDISAVFDFAVSRGWCDANPVFMLRALVAIPKSQSKAVLLAADLRQFFKKLAAYRGFPDTDKALRLIMLTAARPGEVAQAEWSEIDFEAKLWRRPAEKMKAREDHVSPLSDAAVSLLRELREMSPGRFLIPRRDAKERPVDRARFSVAMRGFNLGERASP
ncbi:MAG: integrase arm-type DNA-binding domain-containing protein, partial [Rhodocyclaceae bacterium]|nr:integrase arm-type DNA-binding domain-containing protein [Rhodocyclaceae bacterium]